MDTSSAAFQISLTVASGIFGSITGAIASNYLLPGGKSSPSGSVITGNITNSGAGSVTVTGGTTLVVTTDNRVFITAPAVRNITSSRIAQENEETPRQDQDRKMRERQLKNTEERLRRLERNQSSGDDDSWDELAKVAFIVVAVLLAISAIDLLYLQYRDLITLVATVVTSATSAFIISAVISATLRKVRLDWKLNTQIVLNVIITVFGLYGFRWLTSPVSGGERTGFSELINRKIPWDQFGQATMELVKTPSLAGAVFLQSLGLIVFLTVCFFIFMHTLIIFQVISVATRTRANPNFSPSFFRVKLMSFFGGPNKCWWTSFLLSLMSIVLMAGYGGAYIDLMQNLSSRPFRL